MTLQMIPNDKKIHNKKKSAINISRQNILRNTVSLNPSWKSAVLVFVSQDCIHLAEGPAYRRKTFCKEIQGYSIQHV